MEQMPDEEHKLGASAILEQSQGNLPDLDTLPVFKNKQPGATEGEQDLSQEQQVDDRTIQQQPSAAQQHFRGSPSPNKRFKAKNVDEQPVPALSLQAPIDFNTVDEDNIAGGIAGSQAPDAGEGLRYIDIKSTLKSKADAMLLFFGEECTVKIFHRRWQFREEGVKKFIEQIPQVFERANAEN